MKRGGCNMNFRIVTLQALLTLGLAGCSEPAPTAQSRVQGLNTTRVLPWSILGYRAPGPESQAAGPSSLAVGPSGKIFVLDALRARILEVGSAGVKVAAKVPATVEDLAVGEDGAFLVYSPLRARAWIFDAEGAPAGEVRVPRALRLIRGLSLGKSHQVFVHDAYQQTLRLGSPATAQTLPAMLHSRREGAFFLDAETGVVALRDEEGRAEVRLVSSRTGRSVVKRRIPLADKVLAVRIVGVTGGVICLRLEQSASSEQKGPLRLQRQALCVDAKSGQELLREPLPPPGDYVPRRELALGGDPLRLVQISPGREGLALRSWSVGGAR